MSAFVVQDRTINRVLSFLERDRWQTQRLRESSGAPGATLAELGAALRALNVRAVQERYPECGPDDLPGPVPLLPFVYAPELVTPIAAYKALGCLIYQCSEGTVPETALYRALDDLHNRWAHELVCRLPEYDRAAWD